VSEKERRRRDVVLIRRDRIGVFRPNSFDLIVSRLNQFGTRVSADRPSVFRSLSAA